MCPERHFFASEILAFAALSILRFDEKPNSGPWFAPTVDNSSPATSIHQPGHDMQVTIWPHDSCGWAVNISGRDRNMGISVRGVATENAVDVL